jgi:hypothetical protein
LGYVVLEILVFEKMGDKKTENMSKFILPKSGCLFY